MTCKKCNSNNVNVQAVTETYSVKKKRGLLYWLLFIWIIDLMLWVFLTLPRLLIAMFRNNQKVVSKTTKMAICQSCAYSWNV